MYQATPTIVLDLIDHVKTLSGLASICSGDPKALVAAEAGQILWAGDDATEFLGCCPAVALLTTIRKVFGPSAWEALKTRADAEGVAEVTAEYQLRGEARSAIIKARPGTLGELSNAIYFLWIEEVKPKGL
jgi:hypothetical protein